MSPSRDRVLITGAAGFIGACLSRDLIAAGHEVHVILRPGTNTWRLAGLDGQYTAHVVDLCDANQLQRAVAICRPEVIFHLAAHGANHLQNDRAAIMTTTVVGTANLLDALAGHDYRALVYTGTSSEYGHKTGPMRPNDKLDPRTDYAAAKATASRQCLSEARRGRPVLIVRVFSAYGPWEDPCRLVPYVMNCCYKGEPARVSIGWQPRDFIHVDDVISLLKAAARSPRLRGHVLHACTGQQHTVREMVETIVSRCGDGRDSAIFGMEPVRPGEPASWVGSIDETIALTQWRPRHVLSSGVDCTWAWHKEYMASGSQDSGAKKDEQSAAKMPRQRTTTNTVLLS